MTFLFMVVCLIVIHNWIQLLSIYHYITVHWDVRLQAVTDTASSVAVADVSHSLTDWSQSSITD